MRRLATLIGRLLRFVALLCLCGSPAFGANAAAGAAHGTVIARALRVTRHFSAFGEIRPVAVTVVRAVEAGLVRRAVLPGTHVRRGQVLAVIGGPQAQAVLARRRDAVRATHARLLADRRQFAAQLVTRQRLAADEAAYATARSALRATLHTLTVRAPARGEVLDVSVADGTEVLAGQRLLTLQTGRLWLHAKFYGAAAARIRRGMKGRFLPATGGPAVAVKVVTVSSALGADDGERVLLRPIAKSPSDDLWRNGRWGTVRLDGATHMLVAVPTRALILDRAHWWVLVRTARGDRRQPVVPGPTRGWLTCLRHGVHAGERVVVQDAYLMFHQGIARRYSPPG